MADAPPRWLPGFRLALLLLSLAGGSLFAAAFAATYLAPGLVERGAREIIRIEVQRRVGEKLDDLSASRTVILAQKALGKTDAEIAAARRDIQAQVPRKVADVIADMARADCPCRQRLREALKRGADERLSSLSQLRERLSAFVESAYAGVAHKLLREARIFTGANAAVFFLLAGVTHRRRAAAPQLALPALVLVGAAACTGYLYLFKQDWLHTMLFDQYLGWAYAGYLLLAVALLSDVALNRARVCTRLVNGALQVVGSASIVVAPC